MGSGNLETVKEIDGHVCTNLFDAAPVMPFRVQPPVFPQVCVFRCGKQLLPFRQIAFGHTSSRSDIAARMDRPDEVWLLEGFFREYLCGALRHHVVVSSRQTGRERLHRLLPLVST